MIPFAVADKKYIILGTQFFGKNLQNSNIQDFTMNFKHFSNFQPTIACFTTLIEKIFPFFSFIYQINFVKSTSFNPNNVQTLHFPLTNTKAFLVKTENHEPLFDEMPQIQFRSKLKR